MLNIHKDYSSKTEFPSKEDTSKIDCKSSFFFTRKKVQKVKNKTKEKQQNTLPLKKFLVAGG